ncbi:MULTISPECIES: hypothetical protein [Streptomyces]|uniref:Secreted protein n=1 Tax=Streptomyces venezuelae (strain ATCC 10712 / CBS 650.69 / DSM 40230 / JCM 4526 / NBRC 13096 / PD 04745) TaxID=953739 RepID=F2RLA4_STRVP|nr:hypothetical protein [Streptomyces venezuelae]APE23535.1 hypothetical protein vnz_22620 [Streptomyces venezuelae]QES00909.1 hypothetical protein DEJ43_22950 [Streptomyces venezuelae ATCC 10712]QES08009.1 hypothetical protein DEJ44_21925 [Streptomyces venezuelae]QES13327.1 hypothetical protein DEJ45_13540 [Streptomyces venezuelae]CCA57863.1 hypothetical protein SVEN_4577 [Streptomyces venezuelae ATCC 10712]
MARHAEPRNPRRSALLKAGLGVTAAGAAMFGAAGAAQAAAPVPLPVDSLTRTDAAAAGEGALSGVTHGIGPLTRLQLDPLANTGVDPLDNGLGTQVADFKPVGTNLVTDHVTKGGAAADLPVVGPLSRQLLP